MCAPRRGKTQALLIITHSCWGTVRSYLLQTRRASDILCMISISRGQSESYSHRLTIYTLSRQRLCGKKRSKGFADLLVLVGISREEKQRTRSKTATTNHSESSCQLYCLHHCVAYGSPQPAPRALWHKIPICCNPHSSHFTYTLLSDVTSAS